MNIKYTCEDKVIYKEIQSLFSEMDTLKGKRFWPRDIFHYAQRTKKQELVAIKGSFYITARDNGKLIGLMRGITDSYFYYIIEGMVLPKYQGKGIGTKLMNLTIEYCKKDDYIKIFLFAIPGNEKLWGSFGYKNTLSQAMEIRSDGK